MALETESLTIPGKTFLLGEYAVLAGLPAIVAAVPPRFGLKESSKEAPAEFHPESPAGKLFRFAAEERKSGEAPSVFPYEFVDPHRGAGGFGASTAQFALVYRMLGHELGWSQGWEAVWSRYRELSSDGEMPPSGADLAAQWLGGIIRFQIERSGSSIRPVQRSVSSSFDWSALMIFSASHQPGRKTATHQHLGRLGALHSKEFPAAVRRLELPLEAGLRSVAHGDLEGFGQAMDLYADELRGSGLEIDATFADRQALRKLPGVLGVKGTGAYQSDAIVVLAGPDEGSRSDIVKAASARDLRLVTRGLAVERGIG